MTRRNRRRRATKNEVWGFGSRNDEKKRAIAHGAASLEPSARTRSGCWEVVEERDEGKGKGRGRTGGRTKFGMDGKSAARACRGRWGTRRKGEIWRAQRFFSLSKASSYPIGGVASGPLGLCATGPLGGGGAAGADGTGLGKSDFASRGSHVIRWGRRRGQSDARIRRAGWTARDLIVSRTLTRAPEVAVAARCGVGRRYPDCPPPRVPNLRGPVRIRTQASIQDAVPAVAYPTAAGTTSPRRCLGLGAG